MTLSRTQRWKLVGTICAIVAVGACATQSKNVARPANGTTQTARVHGADAEQSLTVMDQSEAPEDVALTQSIRRSLVDAPELSFAAKNVKIITRDRKVTLLGSMTADERAAVVERVRAVAGVTNVDDKLDVK